MQHNVAVARQMEKFWDSVMQEIQMMPTDVVLFKYQEVPLARIKKIMKLDEDTKWMMVSSEAPVLMAKAVEIFTRELTLRAWRHTQQSRRRTLLTTDLAIAIYQGDTDHFDFLVDLVPRVDFLNHVGVRHPGLPTSPGHHISNFGVSVLTKYCTPALSDPRRENHDSFRMNVVQRAQSDRVCSSAPDFPLLMQLMTPESGPLPVVQMMPQQVVTIVKEEPKLIHVNSDVLRHSVILATNGRIGEAIGNNQVVSHEPSLSTDD